MLLRSLSLMAAFCFFSLESRDRFINRAISINKWITATTHSIMMSIMVHFVFNFITIGSKGGVAEGAASVPAEQVVIGMLVISIIPWSWGGYLLWKEGKDSNFASPAANISTI